MLMAKRTIRKIIGNKASPKEGFFEGLVIYQSCGIEKLKVKKKYEFTLFTDRTLSLLA